MLKRERHKKIIEYLMTNKTVRTSFLSEKLQVSEVTIRKDLKELEEERMLIKTHGGAVLGEDKLDFPFNIREIKHMKEKRLIAKKAIQLINESEVIFLDAGTTTLEIARKIKESDINRLSVVTNSLQVTNTLADSQVNLKLIGGDLVQDTLSFVGPDALKYLKKLTVNKLFLGASGISLEYGITNTNIFEAELKKEMIKVAREVVLVADSSKIDNLALNRVAGLEDIDILITNLGVDKTFIKKAKNKVDLILI